MPKSLKVAFFAVAAVVALYFGQTQLARFFAALAVSAALTPSSKGFRPSREGQQALRDGAAVRAMAFGRVKLGADAHPIYDTNSDNRFLRIQILNHGEIDSFETFFLDSEEVGVDGNGLVNVSTDNKWNTRVWIVGFLGSDAQTAMAEPLADYSLWTTNHRLRGCAGVWIKQRPIKATSDRARHVNRELFFNAVIKASNQIFDPRGGGSTGWSDNAALVLLWYLTHADGRNLALADIDLDSFKAAATICDELVALKAGGTEKRYRSWGQVSLDDDQNDIIQRMLANMDAAPYFTSTGKLAIQISDVAVTADTTFTEGHVLATEFQAGPRAMERFNRVLAVITSGDHDYQEMTAPAYEDTADIAANGAKTFRLELPFCPSQTQAQRLSKKTLLRLNPAEQGTLRLNMAGLFARPGAAIKLDYDNAETNGDMRVSSRELSPEGTSVTLEVATISSEYNIWSEDSDEKVLITLPAVNDSGGLIAAPTGVNAVSAEIVINQATPGAALKITWTDPVDDTLSAEVEVSVDGVGKWFGRQVVDSAQAEVTTGPLEDGETYDARVRFVGPAGGVTAWTTKENVTIGASSAALTAPVITAFPSSPSPSTDFNIEGTAPDSSEFWKVHIYRNTVDTFGSATKVASQSPGQNTPFVFIQNLAADTYFFWSTAENLSASEGTESSSITVVVA